jgi:hypothetical protein
VVALLALALALPGRAASLKGVTFDETLRIGQVRLSLHGLGLLRWRIVFKAYVAALYLDPEIAADRVLEDVPKRLEIEYFHSISAESFAESTRKGIARNVSDDTYEALRPRIEQLNALYRNVKPGDRYALTYIPGEGSELALNGESLGRVPGGDFASAVFAIWLGNAPIDQSLKEQLLGS